MYRYSLYCVIKGIAKTILLTYESKISHRIEKPYAVFIGLSRNNLPLSGSQEHNTLISWFNNSNLKRSNIKEIWAQVRGDKIDQIVSDVIKVSKNIFPNYNSWLIYIIFICKSIFSLSVSFLGLLRGRWWYGLLYDESVYFNYVSLCNREDLAKDYFFHGEYHCYKPLWTYEAESKGSQVNYYYYSVNMETFNYKGYKKNDHYGFKIFKWNNIIVWDKQQKEYVEQYRSNAKFQIVGAIPFSDNGLNIIKHNSRIIIAVFDVTPTRPTFYTQLGYAKSPYWSTNLSMKFFSDIGSLKNKNDITIFWKKKRLHETNFTDRGYIKKLYQFIDEIDVISIDPGISAHRIIKMCDLVISMPFTSTAIIAKEMGKPSIYYDALGSIEINTSHGIPVIKSKTELRGWYYSLNIEKAISNNA